MGSQPRADVPALVLSTALVGLYTPYSRLARALQPYLPYARIGRSCASAISKRLDVPRGGGRPCGRAAGADERACPRAGELLGTAPQRLLGSSRQENASPAVAYTSVMPYVLELAAVLTSTLFAGASVYINLVEHPARLSCGTEIAARQWAPSYKRATVMQVSLALVATLAGVGRGMAGGGTSWFVAAGLIVAVIPFTAIVVLPTNHRLLAPGRDHASAETRQLLERWGRLHAVRSALSLTASMLFIIAAG